MNSTPSELGVLLVGHGSVDRVEDVAAFVSNIRHGRPTPQTIVDEVAHRWKVIGGSPLLTITQSQASALESRLGIPVAIGMRMWNPYVRDVLPTMVERGVRTVVSLPLAPFSVGIYNALVSELAEKLGIRAIGAPPWGTDEALVEAFAESVTEAFSTIDSSRRGNVHLLLTAHSLPTRVIRAGDRYEHEVRATAAALFTKLAWSETKSHVAFQSQGMDGGDWLGPDLPTTFATLQSQGVTEVIVCAIGFLADHTEILYDLDIEARAIATKHGITLFRAPSLNVRGRFIDALERVARATIERGGAATS